MFSFVLGLGLGFFIGVFGLSCLRKLTNSRTHSEKNKYKIDELNELFNEYPAFMSQMKNELNDSHNRNIREFFVVDNAALMNSAITRLRFDLSEEILPVINKLEQLRYIERLPNDSLLYKMDENFIHLMKSK